MLPHQYFRISTPQEIAAKMRIRATKAYQAKVAETERLAKKRKRVEQYLDERAIERLNEIDWEV